MGVSGVEWTGGLVREVVALGDFADAAGRCVGAVVPGGGDI